MNFVLISSPDQGSRIEREWRGYVLARAVQNTHHSEATILPIGKINRPTFNEKALFQSADAVIIEASSDPAILAAIQHLKMLNKTVFLDLVPRKIGLGAKPPLDLSAEATASAEKSTIKLAEGIQWQMRLADAVLSPSPRLIEDIRGFACGVFVPEYIDLDRYGNIGKAAHPGVVLGWTNASLDPEAGLHSGVLTALEHICLARPSVRVEIFGGDPAIINSLALPSGSMGYTRGPADKTWPAPLSYVDIGLAPLCGDLDQRRGWLDVLEFMAMKIPWIASQGSPYYDLRPYGWVVENNPATWERVLMDIIDHLAAYSEEAQGEPYLFTMSQGIDENIESILGRFAEIIGQLRYA